METPFLTSPNFHHIILSCVENPNKFYQISFSKKARSNTKISSYAQIVENGRTTWSTERSKIQLLELYNDLLDETRGEEDSHWVPTSVKIGFTVIGLDKNGNFNTPPIR